MKAGDAVLLLDIYDWLPPYGENALSLESRGLDLAVKVDYDAENEGENVLYRELLFNGVCAFYKSAFPGVPMLDIDYESSKKSPATGTLVEYPDSEVAQAWTAHFGGLRAVKHYRIAFLSENVLLEVFAENVTLSDEQTIPAL
ncbi:hypothetical protein AAGQ96_08135 [Pantoea sp. MBD-2R]|uniref:hypothetical protein n=1 Tax=Pantoea sp. MBD-2R TaxID=3141540 RepID=UPI003183B408